MREWPESAAKWYVLGRGPAPSPPVDDVNQPYGLYYIQEMYLSSGQHQNAQVNAALKNPKNHLLVPYWELLRLHHVKLCSVPSSDKTKEWFTGREGQGVLDSSVLGRGQGESSIHHFQTRAVLSRNSEAWGLGKPNQPTLLPPWLIEELRRTKDCYGTSLYSQERSGKYLYQLCLAPGVEPLLDQVLNRANTSANVGGELFKLAEWIGETRNIPYGVFPGRIGSVVDMCTVAIDDTLSDDEYHDKVDKIGKEAWEEFREEVVKQAIEHQIPGCNPMSSATVLPISVDIEETMTIAGTGQSPRIAASVQLPFLGANLTLTLPLKEIVSEGKPQIRFHRAHKRPVGKWTEKEVRETPVNIVRHPTRHFDRSTVSFFNTGKLPSCPAHFILAGSGIEEDVDSLKETTAEAPEERLITGCLFVETHRLIRSAQVIHQRSCYGLSATSLSLLGVAGPSKMLAVYTRLFHLPPDRLPDGLELYRSADSYLDNRNVWTTLLVLVSKFAPVTSKPHHLCEEAWLSFSLSCFLLEACGPSSNPELDYRRFTIECDAENDAVLIQYEDGLNAPDLFDTFCTVDSLSTRREPLFLGHERACSTSGNHELEAVKTMYKVPAENATQKVKNTFEKKHGVGSARYRKLTHFWADPVLAELYKDVGMAPTRTSNPGQRDDGTPVAPNLQGENSHYLAVRLLWEMGQVHQLNKMHKFDREPEACWHYVFNFATRFRKAWNMSLALPYKPRILQPPRAQALGMLTPDPIITSCEASVLTPEPVDQARDLSTPRHGDVIERDVASCDRLGMDDEEDLIRFSPVKTRPELKSAAKTTKKVKSLWIISQKETVVNQSSMLKDTACNPTGLRDDSSHESDHQGPGDKVRKLVLVSNQKLIDTVPSKESSPCRSDRSRSKEKEMSKRKRSCSPVTTEKKRKLNTKNKAPYKTSVRYSDLISDEWLELYNGKKHTTDQAFALCPVTSAQFQRLHWTQRREVTGLEGYKILKPKSRTSPLNWKHNWGPIPQEFIDKDPEKGILPSSFEYNKHGTQVVDVINENRRHWRVIQLARRLGYQFMKHVPEGHTSWARYFCDPKTINEGVMEYPAKWLRPLAAAMGVRNPLGIVGSTFRMSEWRRKERLSLVHAHDKGKRLKDKI